MTAPGTLNFVTCPSQWSYSLGVHLGTNARAFRYLYGALYRPGSTAPFWKTAHRTERTP